jgi:hypothetical protein
MLKSDLITGSGSCKMTKLSLTALELQSVWQSDGKPANNLGSKEAG